MRFHLKKILGNLTLRQRLRWCLIAAMGLALSGCGEFFAKKPTELESKMVIRDIARVRENPHVANPLPEMYRTPPKRLVMADGVRMFYFTKHHSAKDIADDLTRLGYKVSQNPSTNQIIIPAADDAECDLLEEYLSRIDVPPIQVHVDCIILERFGDVTKDWETTILIENLFGEKITLGEDKFPKPAFPGASLRETQRSTFGMDFGYWRNEGIPGHQVRAVVDILESRGYLKILLNPTLETVNGKAATVQIRDRAPIEVTVTEKDGPYKLTKYEWVADTLTVTPFVYADGSIGLKTNITIGSKSKPEGVVQTPIITQRSIEVGENRIEPGKSLMIGGMRKSENRSVIRGVPFLKDLPLIGTLFSSKDFEENATEIIFILTPTVSSGGVEYSEMADMIRTKYRTPDYDTILDDLVTDPLAGDVYAQYVEDKADRTRAQTVRIRREAKRAEFQAEQERLRAEAAILQIQALQAQAEKAKTEYEQAVAQEKASQAQAEAAAKETQMQQALIGQTEEEIKKVAAAAAVAQAAAQKAQAELDAAAQKAEAARQELEKINARQADLQAEIDALTEPKEEPSAQESSNE